ncbi:hypothetical protein [Pseudomonas sp. PB120]|uniref:hypothetical protein n=1 Tax=Pseudomonas sp. PB120 TaxID=2494700 RepID=UPI0021140ACA|nr:hypothetical protein [Pseudomonas sp. PB120]
MAIEQAKNKQADRNYAYLKMRAEHRSQLVDLEMVIDDDVYADKPSGLLNGPKLKTAGLTVKIPKWTVLPPAGSGLSDKIQLQIDRGSGSFVNLGPAKEFSIPAGETDFPDTFPNPMTIAPNDLPRNATCRLKYTFQNFAGDPAVDSQIYTFICDVIAPNEDAPPKIPVFTGDFLDDTNLPVGGKLTVTVPGYPDWNASDEIAFYLIDSKNIPDDPLSTPPIYVGKAPAPGITNSTVELDGDLIRAFGDANALLTYALRDKALNASPPAFYKKVSLTFGPLPIVTTKPKVPQANPVLTMTHVQEGVSVWIDKHQNFKAGDEVRLKWGNQILEPDIPLGNNPLPTIELDVLPATLMLEDYGRTTTGTKSTNVSYHIVRSGRLFGPQDDDFDVNFDTVLPWPDPWPPVDWPDPVHPDLLEGEVKNHDGSRTNELTRADKDKNAIFHFDWYDKVENGHILNFYWNGQPVTEARLEFDDTETGHVPGDPFQVTIPWAYIKAGMNGDEVPVHYQVSGPGIINELWSETTLVDVNAIAVDLPAGSFPSFATAPVPEYPACSALESDGSLKARSREGLCSMVITISGMWP